MNGEKNWLDHECTSWMVFDDLTGNNTHILHKNRDAEERNIDVALSSAGSPRKWIALGTDHTTNMGINDSGLAGAMNSGEVYLDPTTDDTKKTTPAMLQVILESCDTAAQAVTKLQELLDAKDYWHGNRGSIFFFLDRDGGYVCEITAHVCNVLPCRNGYVVRANIWQNPGMQIHSRGNAKDHLHSSARAYIACSGLNQLLDRDGKITLPGIWELSRHCCMPEDTSEKNSVCNLKTNSTATLEIDRQYPGILSTGYFTIGAPRHTVYIPVPVCTESVLPEMGGSRWSEAAVRRYDELGLDAPVPGEWLAFEAETLAVYSKAKEDARQLLDKGRKEEAVALLNAAARNIWEKAAALLGL